MLKRFFAPLGLVLALAAYVLPVADAKAGDGYNHHVVFQINDNDPARMNLVMNNAANVSQHFASKGQKVKVEIVAYGPGLTMLVPGKSPVDKRIVDFAKSFDNISFEACGNTKKKMEKKAGGPVKLYEFAEVVPAGVIHIMERQDQGWHYIRP